MRFWLSAGRVRTSYPWQLIPWYDVKSMCNQNHVEYMVDSGVRREPPSIDDLVGAQLIANVAVAPDVLGDPGATIERTKLWLPQIRAASPRAELVLCTQGNMDGRIAMVGMFRDQIDVFGAGLAQRLPGIDYTPRERMDIIERLTPVVHAVGARFHVFGTGCTGGMLGAMLAAGVDSFDSASPIIAASMGRVYNADLRQVSIGGGTIKSAIDARLSVNLSQLAHAMRKGVAQSTLWDFVDDAVEDAEFDRAVFDGER